MKNKILTALKNLAPLKTKVVQKLFDDMNVSSQTALFHYGLGTLTAVARNVNIKKGTKGVSIYYVIRDRGGGVFSIYYIIT